ncbi:AMP-binding protein [Trinickia caryophylli]|uniref:D-alanine--poly(Phosphoribitol) ligase subunit 1 n=1 Tax=Trinickia caryophylli TaxID=28094 RepID=A0A1X7F231_TRICW|nr:AMP-binding protein [Trinickia caryophylli]PMS10373.1 D-alanine--poly(phosphoribitol) ligase [Trinickia caryophylli]TRX19503.1 D-alanine--poly(phosphoribitol) ligase [Trinickia caryophylli]WQE13187.1 AMP-binding protein [Trinickia caryophylli]SMF44571.1 D-alanine--poly(phosphoribitol) ligase subunit 1 [Trinickia caryophylli]GLU34505.1 D-alanine--poly(phosphoribitol) ligase [Trinickia caryophylli]
MHFDFERFEFVDSQTAQERVAVVGPSASMRWSSLRTAVRQWADDAQRAGVRRDVPLVITGHKEPAFLVAMLGCLASGVPFVPVDVINPAERVARITELVRAGLRYDAQARAFVDTGVRAAPLAEKDVAYVMFTSGSTGDPKGVQIGRESLTLFAAWIRDCLALGDAPVFMDQMLFSFDFSLFNWVGALATGGVCALCPREAIADRAAFADYLARAKVSIWACTPSFVRQQLLDPAFDRAHLPDLRVFVFGAESLTPAVAEALWARFPDARIVNSYGPTEATCSTTWVEIDPALRAAAPSPFPIGRAKPYADVFIDDGEICIAGNHVMRGYLNRADLNDTRMFVRGGKRGYRTGDLGHIDENGLVTFRGRRDDQIKLHGYRIELAEIDVALAALPGVRAGAAVALRRADGQAVRIVGFVDPDEPGPPGLLPPPPSLAGWRAELGRRLPSYMVPSELIVCHGFPLTQTDKADRPQLARMYLAARLRSSSEPVQ